MGDHKTNTKPFVMSIKSQKASKRKCAINK